MRDYRFSFWPLVKETVKEIKFNLITKRGLKGGGKGIFLSFFWGWYVFMRGLSLWKYQRTRAHPDKPRGGTG
jgi:hypothetical protein